MFLMLCEEDNAHLNHFLIVKNGYYMFRTVYYFARERCSGRHAVRGVTDPFGAIITLLCIFATLGEPVTARNEVVSNAKYSHTAYFIRQTKPYSLF